VMTLRVMVAIMTATIDSISLARSDIFASLPE